MSDTPARPTLNQPDPTFEATLRPAMFEEFVGQDRVKDRLMIFVQAASERGEAMDHILLHGPPGLGKTTLAHILGRAKGANVRATSGPVIERPGDLAGLLTNLEEGDVLFIDEIHRLNRVVEEYLYSAMEDFVIDIMIDQGPNARSVRLNLPRFTLIGATTRSGLLTPALRSRFSMVARLEFYDPQELARILMRSASILKIEVDEPGVLEIARRARGTPRIANNLLRWVRDYAQVRADNRIDLPVADAGLQKLEIDTRGLDDMDKRILRTIVEKFSGGPVGLNSLAVAVAEEADTIEEVYEPFLIQEGYLKRTQQGRQVTERGYEALGLVPPPRERELFGGAR